MREVMNGFLELSAPSAQAAPSGPASLDPRIGEHNSVKQLANHLGVQSDAVIHFLISLGVIATADQILDTSTIEAIYEEFGQDSADKKEPRNARTKQTQDEHRNIAKSGPPIKQVKGTSAGNTCKPEAHPSAYKGKGDIFQQRRRTPKNRRWEPRSLGSSIAIGIGVSMPTLIRWLRGQPWPPGAAEACLAGVIVLALVCFCWLSARDD